MSEKPIPPRPLSPEERALAEAVDSKTRSLVEGAPVIAGVNAALWRTAFEWREWVRREGRSA